MCTRFAMSCAPGPLTWRYTPPLVLFWNVLWSTSVSSAATVSTLPDLLPNVLRVIRVAVAAGGTSSPTVGPNTNPSMTTWDEPARSNPAEPVSSVPPTVAAAIVMGRSAVPCRSTRIVPLAYEPAATVIRSPGTAWATAVDRAPSDDTVNARGARVCAARLGQAADTGTANATA